MTPSPAELEGLIERLSVATEPSRKLFLDCWLACFGEGINERWLRFVALVNAEAWTDAAMMLVPPQHNADLLQFANGNGHADVRKNITDKGHVGNHATPAIALCIASLRARLAGEKG